MQVIWDDSFQILKEYPTYELSVFFFGDEVHQVIPDQGWYESALYLNSKNNFYELAKELGLQAPQTLCFPNKSYISKINQFHFPCFLKISKSYSGLGVYYCKSPDDLQNVLSQVCDEIPFQVQDEIKTDIFLNLHTIC